MSEPHADGMSASPRLRDGVGDVFVSGEREQSHVARAREAGRRWLARTFGALSWKVLGVFCLVVGIIGLSQPASFYAVFAGAPIGGSPRTVFPGMPTGIEGVAKAVATQFLLFTPVLLATVAAESRRYRAERTRILALCGALLVSQAVGTLLWALAHPILYADGYFPNLTKTLKETSGIVRVFGGRGIRSLAYSGAAVAFYYFVRRRAETAETLHQAQLGREEIEREDAEARLQVMQAQIEPHFLFNTLASVRRLFQTNRGLGKAMLRYLVQYLTASLPRMRDARSTLDRELALALAYLNVQKIRMESRLSFEVDVPEPLASRLVPPMMLATLVENAVIHGIGPLPEGGHIRIRAREDVDRLVLEVADNGAGIQGSWGDGVGLSNIRARLASAFGKRARLRLTQGPRGGVIATIELPLPALAAERTA